MSEGRRISSRRKVPTDRYGDFVGPPLPRKPRTQSANQTQVEESVSLGLTVKSTTKQRRIDLESKREVAKLESEHREVRKQHQTSELIASGLKKDVDGVMEVILSLREKDEDDDRENKIEQEEVKLTKLIEALRSAEQDRDMKMINLQFSEEALNSKKAILQEEAEVEKLEVELEEEKEQQRKSIEGLSKGDKVELISNWAASAGDHTFAKLLEKKMRISAQNQESIPVDDLGATEKEKKVQPDDDDELISVEEDAESEPEDREELEQLRLRFARLIGKNKQEDKQGPNKPKAKDDDSNIMQSMAKAIAAMATALPHNQSVNSNKMMARQIQGRDLPTLTGKPEEWPSFITSYETSTKTCKFSDGENLIRLQRCLKGEALKTVQCLLVDGKGVNEAIRKLRARFGRPGIIINSMIQKVKDTPSVKQDNSTTLVNFGLEVDNLVMTIESLGATRQMANPTLVQELMQKLPAQLQLEWARWKQRKKLEFSQLSDFADWIRPLTEAAFELYPTGSKLEPVTQKQPYEKKGNGHRGQNKQERAMVTTEKWERKGEQRKPNKCTFCEDAHAAWYCPKFKDADVESRWSMVKEKNACYCCLTRGHRTNECKRKRECRIDGCNKLHNRLLHPDNKEKNSRSESTLTTQETVTPNEAEITLCATQDAKVNYNVIPVNARKKDGSLLPVFIALDSYASLTSSDEETRKKLGLTGEKRPLIVKGFQSTTTTEESYVIDIQIVSKLDGKSYTLKNVRTVPKLELPSQSVTRETINKFPHLRRVPLENYNNIRPTILVGMDNYMLHLPKEIKAGKDGEPAAIRTEMGWAVVGPTTTKISKKNHSYRISETVDDPLHEMVKNFFTTEYVGVKPSLIRPRSREDIRAQEIMDRTIRRVDHGWESGLLWRDDEVSLPCNKNYAFQRLKSMERKMDKDEAFAKQYVERIQEYQTKGFARILTPEESAVETSKTFYMPHFMAYNEKKPKKYRFVFDAAAKVNGRSLNDHLLQGPDKLVSLPGTLLKFRQRRIAVTADIKDMFHRVKIRKEDAPAQRFLWRGMDRERDPDVMEMGVLIFGASCSPACAQEVKNKNAEEFKEEFPKAYQAIVHRHYMDDLLDSYDTEEEAIKLHRDITEVHKRGSFHICNWMSNSAEVMEKIHEDLRAKSTQIVNVNVNVNGEDQIERVLGLFWAPEPDQFTFCLKYLKARQEVLEGLRIPTKREVLSLVMSLFDPMGFVATLIVKAKMILQHTWRKGVGWDDEIPTATHHVWRSWLQLLKRIQDFRIPRCYSEIFSSGADVQLHIFGDGSEEAFGAVAYFRIELGDRISTALVMAKSNVAPLKHLTTPRMELQAAVMGARLSKFIKEYIEIKINRTVYCSDNQTVLDWIRADGCRFQQFVGNRIGEIQDLTEVSQWRWVPSADNPADDLTRMDSICDWNPESRWANGPAFLMLKEEFWPKEESKNRRMSDEAERASSSH